MSTASPSSSDGTILLEDLLDDAPEIQETPYSALQNEYGDTLRGLGLAQFVDPPQAPTDFEDRIANSYSSPIKENDDGTVSTHKMAWGEDDQGFYAFPTIVRKGDELVELAPKEADDYAHETGELKRFDTQEEAESYAAGSYKTPEFSSGVDNARRDRAPEEDPRQETPTDRVGNIPLENLTEDAGSWHGLDIPVINSFTPPEPKAAPGYEGGWRPGRKDPHIPDTKEHAAWEAEKQTFEREQREAQAAGYEREENYSKWYQEAVAKAKAETAAPFSGMEALEYTAEKTPGVRDVKAIHDYVEIADAIKRISAGKATSADFDYVLGAYEKMDRKEHWNTWQKIGDLVAEIPGFVVEMALTKGVGAGLRGGTRQAVRRYLKKMSRRWGVRSMPRTTRVVAGMAGHAAQVIPRAAAMPMTYRHTLDEMTDKIAPGPLLSGDEELAETAFREREPGKELPDAFLSAMKQTIPEVLSEMTGPYLGVVGGALGAKVGLPVVKEVIGKLTPTITKLVNGPGGRKLQRLMRKGDLDTYWQEVGEEFVADVMHKWMGNTENYGPVEDIFSGDPERLRQGLEEMFIRVVGFLVLPAAKSIAGLATDRPDDGTSGLRPPGGGPEISPQEAAGWEQVKRDADPNREPWVQQEPIDPDAAKSFRTNLEGLTLPELEELRASSRDGAREDPYSVATSELINEVIESGNYAEEEAPEQAEEEAPEQAEEEPLEKNYRFEYEATDTDLGPSGGEKVQGTIDADSWAEAKAELEGRGYTVDRYRDTSGKERTALNLFGILPDDQWKDPSEDTVKTIAKKKPVKPPKPAKPPKKPKPRGEAVPSTELLDAEGNPIVQKVPGVFAVGDKVHAGSDKQVWTVTKVSRWGRVSASFDNGKGNTGSVSTNKSYFTHAAEAAAPTVAPAPTAPSKTEPKTPGVFAVGDKVKMEGQDQVYKVTRVTKKKITVSFNNINLDTGEGTKGTVTEDRGKFTHVAEVAADVAAAPDPDSMEDALGEFGDDETVQAAEPIKKTVAVKKTDEEIHAARQEQRETNIRGNVMANLATELSDVEREWAIRRLETATDVDVVKEINTRFPSLLEEPARHLLVETIENRKKGVEFNDVFKRLSPEEEEAAAKPIVKPFAELKKKPTVDEADDWADDLDLAADSTEEAPAAKPAVQAPPAATEQPVILTKEEREYLKGAGFDDAEIEALSLPAIDADSWAEARPAPALQLLRERREALTVPEIQPHGRTLTKEERKYLNNIGYDDAEIKASSLPALRDKMRADKGEKRKPQLTDYGAQRGKQHIADVVNRWTGDMDDAAAIVRHEETRWGPQYYGAYLEEEGKTLEEAVAEAMRGDTSKPAEPAEPVVEKPEPKSIVKKPGKRKKTQTPKQKAASLKKRIATLKRNGTLDESDVKLLEDKLGTDLDSVGGVFDEAERRAAEHNVKQQEDRDQFTTVFGRNSAKLVARSRRSEGDAAGVKNFDVQVAPLRDDPSIAPAIYGLADRLGDGDIENGLWEVLKGGVAQFKLKKAADFLPDVMEEARAGLKDKPSEETEGDADFEFGANVKDDFRLTNDEAASKPEEFEDTPGKQATFISGIGKDLPGQETLFGVDAIDEEAEEVASKPLPPLSSLEDNYVKPLSEYADTLFHETSVTNAPTFLPNGVSAEIGEVYVANTANMALGQGSNKGVILEFSAGDIQGQLNRSKPAWEMVYRNGEAEFIAKHNPEGMWKDNVKSVTIKSGAKSDLARKRRLMRILETQGWTSEKVEGGTKYTRPVGVATEEKKPKTIAVKKPVEAEKPAGRRQKEVIDSFPPVPAGKVRLYHGLTRVSGADAIDRAREVMKSGLRTGKDVGTIEGADEVFANTGPSEFGEVGVAFDVPVADAAIAGPEARIARSIKPEEMVGVYPSKVRQESAVEEAFGGEQKKTIAEKPAKPTIPSKRVKGATDPTVRKNVKILQDIIDERLPQSGGKVRYAGDGVYTIKWGNGQSVDVRPVEKPEPLTENQMLRALRDYGLDDTLANRERLNDRQGWFSASGDKKKYGINDLIGLKVGMTKPLSNVVAHEVRHFSRAAGLVSDEEIRAWAERYYPELAKAGDLRAMEEAWAHNADISKTLRMRLDEFIDAILEMLGRDPKDIAVRMEREAQSGKRFSGDKDAKPGSIDEALDDFDDDPMLDIAETANKMRDTGETYTRSDAFWPAFNKALRSIGGKSAKGLTAKKKVSPTGVERAVETAVKDIQSFIDDPKNERLGGYYHKENKKWRSEATKIFPELKDDGLWGVYAIAGAIHSPQTNLEQNASDEVKAWVDFRKKGYFDVETFINPKTGKRKLARSAIPLAGSSAANKAYHLTHLNTLLKDLGSAQAVVDYLVETIPSAEFRKFGKERFGMGEKGGAEVAKVRQTVMAARGTLDEGIPRAFVFGSKVGSYALNNLGYDDYTTIDSWESNYWRTFFSDIPAKIGLEDSSRVRGLFIEASKLFNEKLGLRPSEGQAYRWFYIKQSAEKAGFSPARGKDSDTLAGYTRKEHANRKRNARDDTKDEGGGEIAKYAAGGKGSKGDRQEDAGQPEVSGDDIDLDIDDSTPEEALKPFGYSQDNPGGDWLKGEQEMARAGKINGSVTAETRNVPVDVGRLVGLPGANNEHLLIPDSEHSSKRVKSLAKKMRQDGYKGDEGVLVWVYVDGEAKIAEGNHRIRAAKLAGLESVPVQFRWFAGSEEGDHEWTAEAVAKQLAKPTEPGQPEVSGTDAGQPFLSIGPGGKADKVPEAETVSSIPMFRGTRTGDPKSISGPSFFISEEMFAKTYGDTAEFSLDISNPKVVSDKEWREFDTQAMAGGNFPAAVKRLQGEGYDSVINIRKIPRGKMYVAIVFDSAKAVPAGSQPFLSAGPPKQTKTAAFKKWFGKSKVVDEKGQPQRVYHGTRHADLGLADKKKHNKEARERVAYREKWNEEIRPKEKALSKKMTDWRKNNLEHPDDGYGAWRRRQDNSPEYAALNQEYEALLEKNPIPKDKSYYDKQIPETQKFDTGRFGENDAGYLSAGTYFTKDPEFAGRVGAGGAVFSTYLSLQNPFIHGKHDETEVSKLSNEILEVKRQNIRNARGDVEEYTRAVSSARREALIQLGYDGEMYDSKTATSKRKDLTDSEIVAFHPTQIKSATGNRGTFDAESTDIRLNIASEGRPEGKVAPQDTSGLDATKLSKITKMVGDQVKGGITTFKDLVLKIADAKPLAMEAIGPYLQAAWTEVKQSNEDMDDAGSVDAILSTSSPTGIKSPDKAKADDPLSAAGLKVTEKTDRGKKVWHVSGKGTYGNRKLLGREGLGGSFHGKTKEWRFFNGDPTASLLEAILSGRAEAQFDTGRDGSGDVERAEVRGREGRRPDRRRPAGDAIAATDEGTQKLISRGLKKGITQQQVDDQIEDIGRITLAYEDGKPVYVLGSAAGSGKTFVLGGVIKELRARGIEKFVYVTENQGLIRQVKRDLKAFGLDGVEFITYMGMVSKGAPDATGAVVLADEAHKGKNPGAKGNRQLTKMAGESEFMVYATATPFENPVEAKYLESTGIFDDVRATITKGDKSVMDLEGHMAWAWAHGAEIGWNGEKPYVYWMREKDATGELMEANDWMEKQGIYTHRALELPDELVDSKIHSVLATQEDVDRFDMIQRIYDDAMSQVEGDEGAIMGIMAHSTNLQKRILEASKLKHLADRAKEHVADGKQVVIFVNGKSLRSVDEFRLSEPYRKEHGIKGKAAAKYHNYSEMSSMMSNWEHEPEETRGPAPFANFIFAIASAMKRADFSYTYPRIVEEIQGHLGSVESVEYTGDVKSEAELIENLDAWMTNKVPVMIATIDKGGTGLSYHDTTGKMPERVHLIGTMPWSGTKTEQVLARGVRAGIVKPAHIELIFSKNIPFERRLAAIVGARMRSMRAIVRGHASRQAHRVKDVQEDASHPAPGTPNFRLASKRLGKKGISEKDVKAVFPGSLVRLAKGGGWNVELGNSFITIAPTAGIEVDWDALEKQIGEKIPESIRKDVGAAGEFSLILQDGTVHRGLGIIYIDQLLADRSTLSHEAIHLIKSAGLIGVLEWQALVDRHAPGVTNPRIQEERIARAMETISADTDLFNRIRSWIRRLLNGLGIGSYAAQDVYNLLSTAGFWQGRPVAGISGWAYRRGRMAKEEVAAGATYKGKSYQMRGRPDLANPGLETQAREFADEQDEAMNQRGMPERKADADRQRGAERLLKDYDATHDRILNAGKTGGQLNDEETIAAKSIYTRKSIEAMQHGDVQELADAMSFHEAYRRTGTEAGRAMRARIDPIENPAERIARLISEAILSPPAAERKKRDALRAKGDHEGANQVNEDWAKKFADLKATLQALGIDVDNLNELGYDRIQSAKILKTISIIKSDKFDRRFEYWRNAILSGLKTLIVNIKSNIAHPLYHYVLERPTSMTLNFVFRNPDGSHFDEIPYLMEGIGPGLSRAMRNYFISFDTETPTFEGQIGREGKYRIEDPHVHIPDRPFGRLVRYPQRTLMASDDAFKSLLTTMEVGARALRIAKAETLEKGESETWFVARIKELVDDVDSQAWDEAYDNTLELIFQQEGSEWFKKMKDSMLKFRSANPRFGYIVPFLLTPANIFETGLKKSPLNAYSTVKKMHQNVKEGKHALHGVDDKVAQQMLILAFALTIWWDDPEEPRITGGEETHEPKDRELGHRTYPAYSLKVPWSDRWFSYQRYEPFATTMGLTVDWVNAIRSGDLGRAATVPYTSMLSQMKDKTFMSGISDLFKAFSGTDPVTGGAKWASNFATSWWPNLFRSLGREEMEFFPNRKIWGKGFDWGKMFAKRTVQSLELPGMGNLLRDFPIYNVWGEPALRSQVWGSGLMGWAYRATIPSKTKKVKIFPADKLLMNYRDRIDDEVSFPLVSPGHSYTHNGVQKYMGDGQQADLTMLSGQAAKKALQIITLDPEKPSLEEVEWIQDMVSEAKSRTKKALIEHWHNGAEMPDVEELARQSFEKKVERRVEISVRWDGMPGLKYKGEQQAEYDDRTHADPWFYKKELADIWLEKHKNHPEVLKVLRKRITSRRYPKSRYGGKPSYQKRYDQYASMRKWLNEQPGAPPLFQPPASP